MASHTGKFNGSLQDGYTTRWHLIPHRPTGELYLITPEAVLIGEHGYMLYREVIPNSLSEKQLQPQTITYCISGGLNSKLPNSDEVNLAKDGTGYLSYQLKNGWCIIYISAGDATGTLKSSAGTIKKVATLPNGCRPVRTVRAPLSWQSSESSTIFIMAEPDGAVSIYAATKSSNYYVGEIVFPVE